MGFCLGIYMSTLCHSNREGSPLSTPLERNPLRLASVLGASSGSRLVAVRGPCVEVRCGVLSIDDLCVSSPAPSQSPTYVNPDFDGKFSTSSRSPRIHQSLVKPFTVLGLCNVSVNFDVRSFTGKKEKLNPTYF